MIYRLLIILILVMIIFIIVLVLLIKYELTSKVRKTPNLTSEVFMDKLVKEGYMLKYYCLLMLYLDPL